MWHGAGWTYLIWGAINGICVIVERIISDKMFYTKIPLFVKYIFTMLIVLIFWQLFRYQNVGDAVSVISTAAGINRFTNIPYTWQYYFDAKTITLVIIGVVGATVFGSSRLGAVYNRIAFTKVGYLLQELVLLSVFILAVLFMVNSTYSPFIYFQY